MSRLSDFRERLEHHKATAPVRIPFHENELENIMSILDDLKNLPGDVEKLVPLVANLLDKVKAYDEALPDEVKTAAAALHDLVAQLNAAQNAPAAPAEPAAPAAPEAPAEAAPAEAAAAPQGTLTADVQVGPAPEAAAE